MSSVEREEGEAVGSWEGRKEGRMGPLQAPPNLACSDLEFRFEGFDLRWNERKRSCKEQSCCRAARARERARVAFLLLSSEGQERP